MSSVSLISAICILRCLFLGKMVNCFPVVPPLFFFTVLNSDLCFQNGCWTKVKEPHLLQYFMHRWRGRDKRMSLPKGISAKRSQNLRLDIWALSIVSISRASDHHAPHPGTSIDASLGLFWRFRRNYSQEKTSNNFRQACMFENSVTRALMRFALT